MTEKHSLLPLKTLLFSFHAANTIILSFLPLYLQFKGLNGTEIGWVLATGPLISIFSQPFWGYMSDKYKTVQRMLFICVIGLLLTSVIFFQMNGLIALLIVATLFYFFSYPISSFGDSLAQRRADELEVSFGTIRTWGSIGFATSALLIGELLNRIGIQYMMWPFLFFALLTLIVVIRLEDVTVDSEPIQLHDVTQLLKNKSFMFFLLIMMLITIGHRANDSFIGLYIHQLGGSEGLVGLAWFIGVASEALVFAFSALWFRKYHPLIFVIIGSILYSIRWFLFALVDTPMLIISLQFLHGLTFGVFYTASMSYITRLIPNILQSTGHLIFYAAFFGVSGVIGSLIGGRWMELFGGSYLYTVLGILAMIGATFLILYYTIVKRKTINAN